MATVAELLVKIGGDSSGLRKEIAASQRQLKRGFGADALGLSSVAEGLLAGLAATMGIVGVAAIKMSSDFAASKTAFTTLLGSADKAETMLNDLATFAADTPFELPGLIKSAQKLMAFQFAAEDIIPIMSAVGDAISLVGGGQEAIDGVVRALGQIQAKGKLSAEEMNQLSERGINGWKYIADEMGISVAEVMGLCQQGAIDSTTAINAVVKGMQTNFAGGMDAMSKTVPGLLSTIKDNTGMVLKSLGDQITTALDLTGILTNVSNFLTQFSSAVQSAGITQAIQGLIPPEAIAAVFVFAGAIGGAATLAMYNFALSTWAAIAPLLPFIAAGAAVGLLAYEIWRNWEPLSNLFGVLWGTIATLTQSVWDTVTSVITSAWETILPVVKVALLSIGALIAVASLPIIAFASLVYVIYDNWQPIVGFFSGLWNDVTAVISSAWDTITSYISDKLGWVVELIGSAWDTIVSVTSDIWSAVISVISSVWDGITSTISTALNWAVGAINDTWNGVGEITSSIWSSVTSMISTAWDNICSIVDSGVKWIVDKMQPLLDLVGAALPAGLKNFLSGASAGLDKIKTAASGISLGFTAKDITGLVPTTVTKPNQTFTGLHSSVQPGATGQDGGAGAAGAADKAASEAEKAWEDLQKKADQVSDAIEKEWVQTTKTQLDQLEIWKKKEIDDLDVIKAGYEENGQDFEAYEDDKAKVLAVYSARQTKILRDEAKKSIDIANTVRDAWKELQYTTNSSSLTGNSADLAKMASDNQNAIDAIGDKWDNLARRYATSTEAEKAIFLKNLDKRGVAYEKLGNGEISFEANKLAEKAALNEKYNSDLTNRYKTCKDIQSNIDAAYAENSMSQLKGILNEENALRLSNYNAQQAVMKQYYDTWLASHISTTEQISNILGETRNSFKTLFTDTLTGAKTFGEAFTSLFASVWGNIVNSFAEKWSASITNSLMSSLGLLSDNTTSSAADIAGWSAKTAAATAYYAAKTAAAVASQTAITTAATTAMATMAATSAITAASIAAAWAPAAAMVSLASFGANSAPAMAGIAATSALSLGLAVPALASGGITTGPSLAMIGEGKYDEAVLPLNKKAFEKAGLTGNDGSGQPVNNHLHLSMLDTKGFDKWLENGGGAKMEKYFGKRALAFAGVKP